MLLQNMHLSFSIIGALIDLQLIHEHKWWCLVYLDHFTFVTKIQLTFAHLGLSHRTRRVGMHP